MKITRKGYGQVEPNHLSAKRNGQIYAQYPAVDGISELQNGMFVTFDGGKVKFATTGEQYLVYNEVKVYDTLRESTKDFALKAEDCVSGVIVPRLFKTNVGDIMTTNMVDSEAECTVGATLAVGDNGTLTVGGAGAAKWTIVALTTMPDGQPAVKVMRTA